MQLKKRNKLSIGRPKTLPNHSNDDFTSILNESPWERFVDKAKPLVKVLLVVAIIGGSIYGGTLLFGNKDSGKQSTEYASNSADHQSDDKEKLYQCLDDVAKANPSPETNDPEFYKKLIGGYDKRLGCYEKYPGIDLAGKSQLAENRKSVIDSSGSYKNTYLANGGSYDYVSVPSGHGNHSETSSSGNISSSSIGKSTQAIPGNTSKVDTVWCSRKKVETNTLYSQYQSARNKVDAIRSEIFSINYSRPSGFTGSQSQLDAWRASERQRLWNEAVPLQAVEREVQQKYNVAQSEYSAKGCY